MNLSASTGESIEDPTNQQIQEVLTWLPPGDGASAILGQSEQDYMHASGSEEDGFMLEYREGSDERHFRATDYGLALDKVVETFQKYAAGDRSFPDGIEWEPAFAAPSDAETTDEQEGSEPEEPQAPDPEELPFSPDSQTLPDMSAAIRPTAGCLFGMASVIAVVAAVAAGTLIG